MHIDVENCHNLFMMSNDSGPVREPEQAFIVKTSGSWVR